MTDRLTLSRAFEEAGIKSEAADRLASEIYQAIHDNVATKTDLRDLEQRLNLKLAELETKLTIRAAVIAIVGLTALFGALHYWPPH